MANITVKQELVNYKGEKKLCGINLRAVDPYKLRAILADKHIIMGAASANCASSSLSSQLSEGYMPMPMIIALKANYGIEPEEYLLKQPKPEEPKDEPKQEETKQEQPEEPKPVMPIEDSDLYKAMKTAMLDAINEALAGNMKNLRGMIYTAITQARA